MNAHVDVSKLSPEVQAYIASLQANAAKPRQLALKVSAKGAVSLYGMGKWPTTLYGTQWEKVLDMGDEIRAFIAANASLLSVKAPK